MTTVGARGDLWRAVSASARGSSHEAKGSPNQDAVELRVVEAPFRVVVSAVADGHGGQRYVRSDVGSRAAVRVACDTAADWCARIDPQAPRAELVASLQDGFASDLVERWRREIGADLARSPLSDDERALVGSDETFAYGATVLVAIAFGDRVALAQLGDGDTISVDRNGAVGTPIPSDARLVAGQTTSLCLPNAAGDFRCAVLGPADCPELVVLSSDGYGNSFAEAAWQDAAGRDLLEHLRTDGVEEVAERLPEWIAASAEAGGDDVTLALVHRDQSSDPPARPAVASSGAPLRTDKTLSPASETRASRLSTGVVAGIAVAALLVGLVVGWLVHTSSDSKDDSASTTTAARASRTTTTKKTTPVTTPPATVIVAPNGTVIAFDAAGAQPAPRVAEAQAAVNPAVVTRATLNGAVYAIDNGALTVTGADGAPAPIDLAGMRAGAMTVANNLLWIVDEAATQLSAVDPSTKRVVRSGNVTVQQGPSDTSQTGSGETATDQSAAG